MKKLELLTDDQRDKRQFVKRHIKGLMKALDPDIVSVGYNITYDDVEYVIIKRKNGTVKRVNVTGDSLFSVTRDVISSLYI